MGYKYLYQKIGTAGFGKTKSIKIAEELLANHLKELNYEKVISRPEGYYMADHQKLIRSFSNKASDNQIEKKVLRDGIINNYKKYTIDYEINIHPRSKQNIDALFIYDGVLFIGEAKGPRASGNEPLLKAVLEIETYSRIINSKQLVEEYSNNLEWVKNNLKSCLIKKAVILFEDNKNSPMYRQLVQKEYKPIQDLMKELTIYAIKAEMFYKPNGKIVFFEGFSPSDY